MIQVIRIAILLNIGIHEPDFVFIDAAVGFINGKMTFAQALYLAADELDTTLEFLKYLVFVSCLTIRGNGLLVGIVRRLLRFVALLTRDKRSAGILKPLRNR